MRRAVFFFIVVLFCCHVQAIAQITQRPDSGGTPVRVTQLGPEQSGPRWSYSPASCLLTPARIVIRDREAWDKQWKQMWVGPACGVSFSREADGTIVPTPIPPAPDVDFNREMIIVAALGASPSGGYGIIIDSAYERSDKLEVIVRSISQGSCIALTVVTRPVDIVRIAKFERPIVFREIKAVMECKSGQPFTIRDEP
jgi:PrcB C-terminal